MFTLSELSADVSGRRTGKRRQHPRAVVDWPVTVITINATYQGKAVNLSRGGVLIHLGHQLDLGESVRLAIEIPECQDTILAKAEIVRVFPLKRGVEQPGWHSIALQFTEISESNLKFFSGNLASEWKEDYSEIDHDTQAVLPPKVNLHKSDNDHRHYVLWLFAFLLLIPILYLLFVSFEDRENNQRTITDLNKQFLILKEQIESYQNVKDSLDYLTSELNSFRTELSTIKRNLPATDTLESMSLELNKQSHLIQQIFDEVEKKQQLSTVDLDTGQHVGKDQFYTVKKGDTLYQISSESGITIRQLKLLNSLDTNDSIFPGQKLIIK